MSNAPKIRQKRENAPCYGCKSRILGCHAQCEAYREYKQRRMKRHMAMMQAYKDETNVECYVIQQKLKNIKRRDGRI